MGHRRGGLCARSASEQREGGREGGRAVLSVSVVLAGGVCGVCEGGGGQQWGDVAKFCQ